MKRKGYQHGMVRCHRILPDPLNPRPETRYLKRFNSPPTAGLFTRVSTKPTNHSKFTGKCGRPKCRACHESPACKSKNKIKGTQKLRYKLGSSWGGFSGTGYLAQMDEEEEEDSVDEVYEKSCEVASLAVYCDEEDEEDSVDEVYEKSCEVASLAVDCNEEEEEDSVDEVYEKSCEVASLAVDCDEEEEEDSLDEVYEKSCEVASLAVDCDEEDEEDSVNELYEKSCEVASLTVDIEGGDEDDGCVDEVYEKSCDVASLAGDIKSGDDNENDKIYDVQFDDEDEDWCFVEKTS